MFNINENEIYLSRGDSAVIGVDIVDEEGDPYVIRQGEVVKFSLKKTTDQCRVIFDKTFELDNEEYVITLEQDDTIGLSFGDYAYDVTLITEDGVYTIIEPHLFKVMEVVHNEVISNS